MAGNEAGNVFVICQVQRTGNIARRQWRILKQGTPRWRYRGNAGEVVDDGRWRQPALSAVPSWLLSRFPQLSLI